MMAISSVDIAKAARAARKEEDNANSGENSESVTTTTCWPAESMEDLANVVYSLWLWHKQEKLLLVLIHSREVLGHLVSILKFLKVSACSIHAMSTSSAGRNAGVIVACHNALGTKRKHLQRLLDGKVVTLIHADPGRISFPADEVVRCWKNGKYKQHPATRDESLKVTVRSRCRLAVALSQVGDAGDFFAKKHVLEAALHAPSPSQLKITYRKMVALGMLSYANQLPKGFKHGTHTSRAYDGTFREVARTRYLDRQIPQKSYLSEAWLGDQRTGAFADSVSARIGRCVREKDYAGNWSPNPEGEAFGGKFGKACAHNEVCLHCVRPFIPLEVVNTRMCSRKRPAPGNDGYDGCLEFLKEQCIRRNRPQTVWDVDDFIWISPRGEVSFLPKKSLLNWSLPRLEFVIPVLRNFTIYTQGRASPKSLLRLIDHLLAVGLGRELPEWWPQQPAPSSQLVVSFLLGGNAVIWRRMSSS